jgi:hypothetical protein
MYAATVLSTAYGKVEAAEGAETREDARSGGGCERWRRA